MGVSIGPAAASELDGGVGVKVSWKVPVSEVEKISDLGSRELELKAGLADTEVQSVKVTVTSGVLVSTLT